MSMYAIKHILMVLAMYGIAAVMASSSGADNCVYYTNYDEKYDYIPAGMDDNQIAFVELFGMIDKADGRMWQTIENVKVLRFISELDFPDLEDVDKYSSVSSAEDLTLNGYDEGIDYFYIAKLIAAGHAYKVGKLFEAGEIEEAYNIEIGCDLNFNRRPGF